MYVILLCTRFIPVLVLVLVLYLRFVLCSLHVMSAKPVFAQENELTHDIFQKRKDIRLFDVVCVFSFETTTNGW